LINLFVLDYLPPHTHHTLHSEATLLSLKDSSVAPGDRVVGFGGEPTWLTPHTNWSFPPWNPRKLIVANKAIRGAIRPEPGSLLAADSSY
jgi:hypothetical protein